MTARNVVLVLVIIAVAGYVGWLQRDNAQLRERAAVSIQVGTPEERRLLDEVGELKKQLGNALVTIRRLQAGFERIAERPPLPVQPGTPPSTQGGAVPGLGTAGGTPVAPGTPGTPLVPSHEAPAVRARATERALLYFDPGTLVGCRGPGLDDNVVELLREPDGTLLSTAPCVYRINDQFARLPNLPPLHAVQTPWKAIAAWSMALSSYGVGAAYEVVRLPILPLTLDAVAVASPVSWLNVGPGVAWRLNDTTSVGYGKLYDAASGTFEDWLYVGFKW